MTIAAVDTPQPLQIQIEQHHGLALLLEDLDLFDLILR